MLNALTRDRSIRFGGKIHFIFRKDRMSFRIGCGDRDLVTQFRLQAAVARISRDGVMGRLGSHSLEVIVRTEREKLLRS